MTENNTIKYMKIAMTGARISTYIIWFMLNNLSVNSREVIT